MAAKITKPSRARFKADLEDYRALRLAVDLHNYKADPQGLDPIFKRCNIAEEKVLGQHAPDVDGVATQLSILWEDDMWEECADATKKMMIIGNLRRLARLAK